MLFLLAISSYTLSATANPIPHTMTQAESELSTTSINTSESNDNNIRNIGDEKIKNQLLETLGIDANLNREEKERICRFMLSMQGLFPLSYAIYNQQSAQNCEPQYFHKQ